MKKLFSILFLMFLIGCQTQPPQKPAFIKKSNDIQKINEKVKKAFDNAKDLEEKHSKWYDRDEKLPLTIIAVAYIDPEIKNRPEFYAYKKLIKEIQNNPNLLPDDLRKLYSSIKFIDYDKSNLAREKFNAAYTHRYDDKEVLNDILRPDNEHPSQELLIRLNYNELKKGNLVIEGYKTVKQKNKLRNSYYFTLRYPNYSKLSKKDKNNVIVNSLFVVLSLSIPEYVSIDMSKIIDKNKIIRILKPTPTKGIYRGVVWKYEVNNEIDKLRNKIKNLDKKFTLIKVLKGHKGSIYSVAISPDGKYALSGSRDKTLRYWDLKTGKTIKVLKGHKGSIYSVAISPDGKYALSGSRDKTLRYWDLKTGKTIKVLKGHTWNVNSVAFSPDGKYAVSGSWDDTLRYWDLKTGETLKVLKGHTWSVNSVAISRDGRYALSGSGDGTLRYWDLKTGKTIKVLKGHTDGVSSVAFSPDGRYALSGSRDATLRYWDLKTGKTIKVLEGHTDIVKSVAISPDGKYALSGSGDTTLRYWDLKTGKTIVILKGHTDYVNSVAFSPDGKYALSGSGDTTLRYWDLKNKTIIVLEKQIQKIKQLATLREHKIMLAILTTPFKENDLNILYRYGYLDNKTLNIKNISKISNILNYDFPNPIVAMVVPAYKDNINEDIKLYKNKAILIPYENEYDLNNLYFTSKFNYQEIGYKNIYNKTFTLMETKILKGHKDSVISVAFNPDGRYALSGSEDKTLRYWDLKAGETIKVLKGHTDWVKSVAISPDGKYALSGSSDTTIRYWNLKTGKTIVILKGHTWGVSSVAFTPDGKYALSEGWKEIKYWNLKTGKTIRVLKCKNCFWLNKISSDGKYALLETNNSIRYWDLKSGEILKVLQNHENWLGSGNISPDGRYALSIDYKKIKYWDLKTGKTIKVLKGHKDGVTSVVFSPDGKYALSGSRDKTLRYWDLKTGKTIAVLNGHKDGVTSVAFSPDGKYSLSGSYDKTLRYWNLRLEEFLGIK